MMMKSSIGKGLVSVGSSDIIKMVRGSTSIDIFIIESVRAAKDIEKAMRGYKKEKMNILIQFEGGKNLTMEDINRIAKGVSKHVHKESIILWGAIKDDAMKKLKVTLLVFRNKVSGAK